MNCCFLTSFNILAAVRLIGSLSIYGRRAGGRPAGGRRPELGEPIIHANLRKRSMPSAFSANGGAFGPNPWPRAFGASRRFVYTGSYFLI